MATRSMIGIEQLDGTIKGIYCHFDGYPSGVGKTLKDYWNNRKDIEDLIALGDLSVLGKDLDDTIAYHRDRGEPMRDVCATRYRGINEFHCQKYAYVFGLDNIWRLYG